MVENNNTKVYRCNECDKNYKDKTGLWYHNNKYHLTNNHKITSKDFQLTSNDYKLTSKDFHQNNQFKCEFCNKIFSRKNNLNYHIKNKCKLKDKVEEVRTLVNAEQE